MSEKEENKLPFYDKCINCGKIETDDDIFTVCDCYGCDDKPKDQEIVYCNQCKHLYETCTVCSDSCCYKCVKKCDRCDEFACCYSGCDRCEEYYCENCTDYYNHKYKYYYCYSCPNSVCLDHSLTIEKHDSPQEKITFCDRCVKKKIKMPLY